LRVTQKILFSERKIIGRFRPILLVREDENGADTSSTLLQFLWKGTGSRSGFLRALRR
jgi:hypothetical protein